ncbi:MAG TPA: hypothetical protein VK874_07880 [Gaiellaceae bacterium]|nr:hypothetical protein [Gaiellaceae bacterium]
MTDRLQPPQPVNVLPAPLVCLECGRQADKQARGWRALIGGGYEGEPREVGVYCPRCAAREFGDP